MEKRPNILFAIADDASHFGTYGHAFVKTPACDWLAKNGVLFRNAFTSNPKCAPSRATILTGRYPWQLKDACNHNCYFPPDYPVYPDLLEQAGYFMGYTGKGWGPGNYERAGYSHNPAGHEFNRFILTPPDGSRICDCDYTENFRDFLRQRPADMPFCFWYGCREPHRKYNYGEGLRGGKRLEEVGELPSYWPDEERVRVDLLDYAYEVEWFDLHLGKMLKLLEECGELDNTLIIATSDNGCPFPRVKGQMYEQDFHLPLIARFGTRSGAGRQIDDLIQFSDFAPTFLEAAGVPVPESITGKSFWNLIVSDQSGRVDPERRFAYFGREKQDVGRENDLGYPVRCVRDYRYLYIRNFAPERWPAGNPETGFTNCDSSPTKTAVLELHEKGDDTYFTPCFGKRPLEELYDITTDPECMKNLASDPAFEKERGYYWEVLQSFLRETGDPRIFGNGDVFEQYPHSKIGMHAWAHYLAGDFQPQTY